MMPPAILLSGRKELEDWDKVVTVSVQEAFAEAGIVKDLNISAPEKQLQVIFAVNIWCDINAETSIRSCPKFPVITDVLICFILPHLKHLPDFLHRFCIQDLMHWPQETPLQWTRQSRHPA